VAFVSEYAVTQPAWQVRNGTFGAALGEAAFLLSLERNRHVDFTIPCIMDHTAWILNFIIK